MDRHKEMTDNYSYYLSFVNNILRRFYMFGKKDSFDPTGFDTILGINSSFEGNIESEGTVRIDGKVKGDLKINGEVFVASSAIIKGNITSGNINLSGTLEGNIYSKGILKLLSTAKLYGDIRVHSFVAEEGAIFEGKCSMEAAGLGDAASEKAGFKKNHSSKDYKKSSVLSQIYDDKEKTGDDKGE
jgi:cytoskeletal protein CcmA (bactofilin family)